MPLRTRRAIGAFNARRGRVTELRPEDFEPTLARCRTAAARLIGAEPSSVALTGNTSAGINLAAAALPLPRGSTVVVSDREFPANVHPWAKLAARGVRLEIVPADERGCPDQARLLERLDRGDVSAFALSAVQYASGYRADLPLFGSHCRERGIFFVIDAIQALGVVPLDVGEAQADIVATGGHKWLCAPFGTGFVYIRPELILRLNPPAVGWTAFRGSEHLDRLLPYPDQLWDEARRFEVATLPLQDIAGLAESLELLLETGVDNICQHVSSLLDPMITAVQETGAAEIVSDLEPARRSGILCFRSPRGREIFERLAAAGVVAALREGAVRIAPHLYNTPDEMERACRALRTAAE